MHSEGIYCGPDVLYHILMNQKDMIDYYRLNSKKNFLKNPNCDEGKAITFPTSGYESPKTTGWICGHGGDWKLEKHIGCDSYPPDAGNPQCNLVSSYMSCDRRQEIDLSEYFPKIGELISNGFSVKLLWQVWVAPRYDCKSKFSAKLDISDKTIKLREINLEAGRQWVELTEEVDITKLLRGKTMFTYTETAKDRQYWAGHYGAKVLSPSIRVRIGKSSGKASASNK